MSTKKLYFCNLCKDEVGGETRRLGRGFRFGAGRFDWDTVQACENHLCDNCVDMLTVSFRQSPPISSPQSEAGK